MVTPSMSRFMCVARLATVLSLAGLGACDLGKTVIPTTEPGVVVHAVLNPDFGVLIVLVERSLTGAENVGTTFDPNNPIAGNGIPIGRATVKLTGPDGFVWTGAEQRPNTGVYQIDFDTLHHAVRGNRYTLSVTAPEGAVVTGSTVIPSGTIPRSSIPSAFNRDRDTLRVNVPQFGGFRALWLRIETGIDPFDLFSVDPDLSVSGLIRNPNSNNLPHVFFPGFQDLVIVAAVDTNLYDYYRSGNDPFTGTGLIQHLTGGYGLFGSVAIVQRGAMLVTQDPKGDAIEGRFTLRRGTNIATEMTLYLETRSAVGDQISGFYLFPLTAQQHSRGQLLGTKVGSDLEILLSEGQRQFHATVAGDTLKGNIDGNLVTYVRAGR
jgi:hypothetical protein